MEEGTMTVQTLNFVYTLAGKNAPYKVMQFDKNGVFVQYVGEVSKPQKELVLALAQQVETPKPKKTRSKKI